MSLMHVVWDRNAILSSQVFWQVKGMKEVYGFFTLYANLEKELKQPTQC